MLAFNYIRQITYKYTTKSHLLYIIFERKNKIQEGITLRKQMKAVALITMCAVIMSGCAGKANVEETKKGGAEKAACIFGVGGLGDQSFNDLINDGLKKAKSELNVDYDYAEPSQVSDFELFLRDMASTGDYSVIISVGFDSVDALAKVSKEFPDQQFALIDSSVDAANVANYECKEQEGAFLVGALAGLMLKESGAAGADHIAGFIGAMDTPIINKFYAGYAAGMRYVNPDASVLKDYVAGDNPFGDTATAKEIAISQNGKGAGMIFHAAGGSGLGVFEAAGEYDFLAIGCNSNQNPVDPDHIAASMLKRVDTAAYEIVKAACVDHDLAVGTTVALGLSDEGLDYTLEGSNVEVGEDIVAALEEIKQNVIQGEIVVPSEEGAIEEFLSTHQ